ncbi:acyltransferase domain-containing protein [Streptomyces tsukubensis]|uniref:acyltransferase domain-containing protein n=1 Tax=Streptomyces tsukubensis TaxID=83656 RepID=UPI00344D6351
MVSSCVILFPGQGAYFPGALAALAAHEPVVAETVDAADDMAVRSGTESVSPLLLDTEAASLADLARSSPALLHSAIFTVEMALFRLLTQKYGVRPRLLLGHSFGELTALCAAGFYSLEDGFRLVSARDAAFASRSFKAGGMVALECSAIRGRHLLAAAGEDEVSLAADNGPRQCVVSGPEDALRRVLEAAQALRIQARRLLVPYPFHHRCLAGVAEDFGERASSLTVRPARYPVYSAILGGEVGDGVGVAALAASHLVRPSRFADAVRVIHARGAEVFLECGPRGTLTDLMAGLAPGVLALAPLRRRAGSADLGRILETLSETDKAEEKAMERAVTPPVSSSSRREGESVSDAGSPRSSGSREPDDTPDRGQVIAGLRALFAKALGYPEDVLTEDADLEAELGVDSIKQTELFTRVLRSHGRALPGEGAVRLTNYTTLGALADLLLTMPQATEPVDRPKVVR